MAHKKMSKKTPHCDVRGKKTGKPCPNKAYRECWPRSLNFWFYACRKHFGELRRKKKIALWGAVH